MSFGIVSRDPQADYPVECINCHTGERYGNPALKGLSDCGFCGWPGENEPEREEP